MRTDKELVQILLDNLESLMNKNDCYGLCSCINYLYGCDKIKYQETIRLDDIINKYVLPYKFLSFNPLRKDNTKNSYWWANGKITPRRKFLTAVLKQLDNEK